MSEYIEKNGVIKLIDKAIENCTWHVAECTIDTNDKDLKALRDKVKAIPPADVAPAVHARWRYVGSNWECSCCLFPVPRKSSFYHWCPQCGARMDGGENNG